MQSKKIVFTEALNAELQDTDFNEGALGPDELIIRTKCSLVSAGTELAIYKGTESWATLPTTPGYAAVGEVIGTGGGVENIAKGDLIFCYSGHCQYSKLSAAGLVVKLPEGCDPKEIVFTRIAAVSITALRVSEAELGDWVAVFGLGVVGNLAAQLFALSGANVIGIDISDGRIECARRCGVEHTINPSKVDLKQTVMDLTGGGVQTVVEATGVPSVVQDTFPLAAPRGEVILLGSPRGECQGDLTALLNNVHLWPNGCITLKGAHEWRYPSMPSDGCKHSIQRNCEQLAELIGKKKLVIEPLITHVESPANAQQMYQGLLNQPDKFVGVVFDWDNVA